MDADRIRRAAASAKDAGIDALFVTNPKNVLYLAGVAPMMEGQVQPFNDPEYFAVIQEGRCEILCDGRYIAEARNHAGKSAIQLEAPVTAAEIARKIQSQLPKGATTIGIEERALLHADAVALMAAMPGITWKACDDLLSNLRIRKSADELDKLRKAQSLTCDAFDYIAKTIRVGMTEREVALLIGDYLRRNADGNSFNPIVAFGETGAHPHYLPSPTRKLQKGQMVLLDFGAIYQGYCGDLTRMLVMGKADARMREVYDLVLTAQERCLKGIRPGISGHDLDALCRDYFATKGSADAFMHGTGHGVGLAIHEAPSLKKTFGNKAEVGMVFTVEPGLYYEGWGGVRIEDMIAVTADGHENLTRSSKKLLELDA